MTRNFKFPRIFSLDAQDVLSCDGFLCRRGVEDFFNTKLTGVKEFSITVSRSPIKGAKGARLNFNSCFGGVYVEYRRGNESEFIPPETAKPIREMFNVPKMSGVQPRVYLKLDILSYYET